MNFVYVSLCVACTALSMGRWSLLTLSSSIAILYCVYHSHDHLCVVVQRYAILSLGFPGWRLTSADWYLAVSFLGALVSYAIVCQ
jgi:hypothetical protein